MTRRRRTVDETPRGYDGPVRWERRIRTITLSEYAQIFIGPGPGRLNQLVEVEEFVKVPDVRAGTEQRVGPSPIDDRRDDLVRLWLKARADNPRASRITLDMMGAADRPTVGRDAIKSRLRAAVTTIDEVGRVARGTSTFAPTDHP